MDREIQPKPPVGLWTRCHCKQPRPSLAFPAKVALGRDRAGRAVGSGMLNVHRLW